MLIRYLKSSRTATAAPRLIAGTVYFVFANLAVQAHVQTTNTLDAVPRAHHEVTRQQVSVDTTTNALNVERFETDANWEGHNNRVALRSTREIKQDFGYSNTSFASSQRGEIGGQVWRSVTPAYYAAAISTRTLDQELTASGVFALTSTQGSSGAFFGWFDSGQIDSRQSSLGLRFAGEGSGARLTLQLVTGKNQACGTKITPWIVDMKKPKGSRKYSPTSIRNDGTTYTWNLRYDPKGAAGNGVIQFSISSSLSSHETFENTTFTVALREGFKQQNTRFDRFGLMNSMRGGNALKVWFGDLHLDRSPLDFSSDPHWTAWGNRSTFQDRDQAGAHDFGYSKTTHCSPGDPPGEIGGTIWRSGEYAYYADPINTVTLAQRLVASGRVVLAVGAPDSGVYLGWFNSAEKINSPRETGSFLGVKVGGPTRVGHYFVPGYSIGGSDRAEKKDGPVLVPRKVFNWTVEYDPGAQNGNGSIRASLGEESVTLALKKGSREKGATFDRFGLFSVHEGGSFVKIYLDDLSYTGKQSAP